jgi:nucleotide-binding universal stress UspA family protein
MFRHILVPLDGTPASEAVLPHVKDAARVMRAQVTLLYVGDAPERVNEQRPYLLDLRARLRMAEITAHVLTKQGPPAERIIEAAKEVSADAIAMATHSRRGLSRMMVGSVAEEIVRLADMPVLLVRAAA